MTTRTIRFISFSDTLERLGGGHNGRGGKTTVYDAIAKGLFPPQVKFGSRSVYPEHEVDAMIAAIVAGATEDERRELVKQLVEKRRAGYLGDTTAHQSAASASVPA